MEGSDEEKFHSEKMIDGSVNENTKKTLAGAMKELRVDKDYDDEDYDDEDYDDVDGNSDSDSDLSDSEYYCNVCSIKFSGFLPFQQHEKGSKHAKALLRKKREKKLLEKNEDAEKITENDEEYSLIIKKPYDICEPCGKQFSGPESYALHMDSKAHKQKVLQAYIHEQVCENGEINMDLLKDFCKNKLKIDESAKNLLKDTQKRIASFKEREEDEDADVGGEEFECKDCKKVFSGLIPYTQHVMSKVHAKEIEKKELLQKIAPENAQYATKSKTRDISHLVVEDDILVCKLCSTSFSGPENAMQHLKSKNHLKKLEKHLRKQEKKQKSASRDKTNSTLNDQEQQKATTSQKMDDSSRYIFYKDKKNLSSSSSEEDNSSNVINSPKEIVGDKYETVESRKEPIPSSEPIISKMVLSSELENTEAKEEVQKYSNKEGGNETLYGYEKYKEYREIMELALKDAADV